jgi:hypothetical protein
MSIRYHIVTMRYRIGDFLFRVLFPGQALILREAEKMCRDAAAYNEHTQYCLSTTKEALQAVRSFLESVREIVDRVSRPGGGS